MKLQRTSSLLIGLLTAISFSLIVGAAPAQAAPTTNNFDKIVVKVDVSKGRQISEVTKAYPVTLDSTLLASRGIYLLRATSSADRGSLTALTALAGRVAGSTAVVYSEPNYQTNLTGDRYHSWPTGPPQPRPTDSSSWLNQPIVTSMKMREARALSQGLGVRIAVLDTGIDPNHPALKGRIRPGYDYVGDDSDPTDVATRVDTSGNGLVDEAYGHGTFVAGLAALVAPDARIIPMRVLDSDGVGNVFVVAQAIMDAVNAGAGVINISLGTDDAIESKTVRDTITMAQSRGVLVVAAAGNDASTAAHYPAADAGVLSVTATSGSAVSTWANRGSWVKVAAPGDSVVGPVPGGGYAAWSGTSMATPIVAGQLALVRSRYPTWTSLAQLNAVTSSSRPLTGVTNGAVDLVASMSKPVPVITE
ncbi:MAG TPA: S8 family serine peptidase [Propionibacteriaceae bacterium]